MKSKNNYFFYGILVLTIIGIVFIGGYTLARTTTSLRNVGFKDLAAKHGLKFGGFYQYDIRDKTYNRIFEKEFNVITVGFFTTGFRPSRDVYDFEAIDSDVNFGIKRGMEVHGHNLVWFNEIPDWIKSTPNSEIEEVLNEHIDKVVGRYADRIVLWDVVNEPVDSEGQIREDHKWYEALGADYISKAFIRAHEVAPEAILRLNEYDIETNEAKFNGIKDLLKSLLDKGIPIHALGWQMHVPTPTSFNTKVLLDRMNQIADMGIDNYITELDVELPEDATRADYVAQKQAYQKIIETFLKVRGRKTLVIWGLRDGDPYWLTNAHPLPYDEKFRKKPAYYGIRKALR